MSCSPRRALYVAASLTILTVTIAAGCSNQTVRDLEDVPIQDPDKIALIVAVDRFPNVVAMCIRGAGFAATTRDGNAALQRVDEWDASTGGWCATTTPTPPAPAGDDTGYVPPIR